MNAFSFIVFSQPDGRAVAHGRFMESALAAVSGRPGGDDATHEVVFCGDSGPLIWAEGFALAYARQLCEKMKKHKLLINNDKIAE